MSGLPEGMTSDALRALLPLINSAADGPGCLRAREAVRRWADAVDAAAPGSDPAPKVGDGAALIAAERRRQVEEEGWTPEHDDSPFHTDGQMALAAACYALRSMPRPPQGSRPHGSAYEAQGVAAPDLAEELWPWDRPFWKPRAPLRNLVRAGALVAAEIDRLARRAPVGVSETEGDQPEPGERNR